MGRFDLSQPATSPEFLQFYFASLLGLQTGMCMCMATIPLSLRVVGHFQVIIWDCKKIDMEQSIVYSRVNRYTDWKLPCSCFCRGHQLGIGCGFESSSSSLGGNALIAGCSSGKASDMKG